MKAKSHLAKNGEADIYEQGLPGRLRSISIVLLLAALSFAVGFIVNEVGGSAILTVLIAGLCGLAMSFLDHKIDPIGETRKTGERGMWLFLFAPVAILLAVLTVYEVRHAASGFDVFQASLTAWLLGSLVGFTKVFFGLNLGASA